MGDLRTTTGQKPPETISEKRARIWRIIRNVFLFIILLGLIGHFIRLPKYAYANGYVTTQGYAEIRATAEGRVVDILRSSGDQVEAGDVLMRLESRAEQTAYEEAKAKIAEVEAEVAYCESETADILVRHRNALKAAELELEYARRSLELTRQLFERSLTSGRQLSNDEFAVRRYEETLRALQEIDETVAGQQLEVLRQRVESLREAAERARVALEQRSVTAPIAGRLMRYTFYPGENIRPDMVLYEIFDGPVNTMKVRVPERHAARIHIGQTVQAKLGTHRSVFPRRFPGKVTFLRPVVENDGANSYRIAYCELGIQGEAVPPGTSAETRIRIGRSSLWMHLLEL